MYQIGKLKIKRITDTMLQLELKGTQEILTEDLAAVISAELPKDRAESFFAETQELSLKKGKVRVVVKAEKDIKKGEAVCFSIDVSRYADGGVRTSKSGILF